MEKQNDDFTKKAMEAAEQRNNELNQDFARKEAFRKSQQTIFDDAALAQAEKEAEDYAKQLADPVLSKLIDEIDERQAKRFLKNKEVVRRRLSESLLSQRERRALMDERKALTEAVVKEPGNAYNITTRLDAIHKIMARHDVCKRNLQSMKNEDQFGPHHIQKITQTATNEQ